MNVLVDTCVWSSALRRRPGTVPPPPEVAALEELIREGRARLVGPVRQELLSGLRDEAAYLALRDLLRPFPDDPLNQEDHELAAHFGNRCRTAGVQGSATDFLLCAVAARRRYELFTTDRDFDRYAGHIPLRLYGRR